MTEEQPHADVVAELFWGPGDRQRGRLLIPFRFLATNGDNRHHF